ncbi:MAG: chromosomal replication initiator protein DnaA [Spirochaetes bacterium]|nr:chromosomal replication initiator protein DnaA [Spirochaetota bacterium]
MDNMDFGVFWNEAMNQLRAELGENVFTLWFNISYKSASETSIMVGVPSTFYRDQLVKNYQPAIERKLLELSGQPRAMEFVIEKRLGSDEPNPTGTGNSGQPPAGRDDSRTGTMSPVGTNSTAGSGDRRPEPTRSRHTQLRTDYTFENFIIGENNNFAANAALAITKNPGTAYNPFLIYGGVGLGKTHLMQSIGNRVWETNEKTKIICITAEDFTNEFIESIHSGKPQLFKNKYRYVDILLIDDIHFLQDKPQSQEELFHTFNALYNGNKQMVFTCDRPVSEIKGFSDRLRNRFERGLNVDLQPPNYETRFAILKKKIENAKINVPNAVLEIISKNISTNVRDLEAALMKLAAYADLVGKEITLEIAQQQLKDVFSQTKHGNITIDHIIRVVAEYFNVSSGDLKGKKRTKNIALPRQVAMYIAREMTEYSTTELGLEFGGRDHTTVMHACSRTEERLKLDPSLETTIKRLKTTIKEMSIK